jgi:GTP cyclohydrolase I
MADVQSESDSRKLAIDRVGVTGLRFPATLAVRGGGTEATVATVNMFVALPADRKGTHMSRFLELLNTYRDGLSPERVVELCRQICLELDAERSHVELSFPYFISKAAPATGRQGLMDYEASIVCESTPDADDVILGVTVPATSLCPCSREISAYGAHNQRCLIRAEARFTEKVWIEELVEYAEQSASCPVYSVLKRPDEKMVTEMAYDNPKFVEDIVRDLATVLEQDPRITWFHARSENHESIHSHNAWAEITRGKPPLM